MGEETQRLTSMKFLNECECFATGGWQLYPVIVIEDESCEYLLGCKVLIMRYFVEQRRKMLGIHAERIDAPIAIVDQQLAEVTGYIFRQCLGRRHRRNRPCKKQDQ